MSDWLLIAAALLLVGSTIGFMRLQFSSSDGSVMLISSIALAVAGLLCLVLAVSVGNSEHARYSLDGLSVKLPPFHFRRG